MSSDAQNNYTEINSKLPKMSNVNGSIRPSNANIYNVYKQKDDEILIPVEINKIGLLGTTSEFSDKNFKSENAKIDSPNLQTVEAAYLNDDVDTFCVKGSLRVVSECMGFNVCQPNEGNLEISNNVSKFMEVFKEKNGFYELSKRYVEQLINGDILFRNKYCTALKAEVIFNDKKNVFDHGKEKNSEEEKTYKEDFEELVYLFANALSEPNGFFAPQYKIYGTINKGGEVYPSQELQDGKVLFRNKTDDEPKAAGMHSQKIGNALRTIDDWYAEGENIKKIPVDPYGPDKSKMKAMRRPGSGKTFYELLVNIEKLTEKLTKSSKPDGDCMFFAAMMVRGGVFSKKDKKESK